MDSKEISEIVRPTSNVIFIGMVLAFVAIYDDLINIVRTSDSSAALHEGFSINYLITPVAILFVSNYLSVIIKNAFKGELINSLTDFLSSSGVLYAVLIVLEMDVFLPILGHMFMLFTIAFVSAGFKNVLNVIADSYNSAYKVLVNSTYLMLLGVLSGNWIVNSFITFEASLFQAFQNTRLENNPIVPLILNYDFINQMGLQLKLIFFGASMFTVLYLLTTFSNPIISYIGEKAGTGVPIKIIILAVISFYNLFKPILVEHVFYGMEQMLTIAEWGSVCLLAIVILSGFQKYFKSLNTSSDILSKIETHITLIEKTYNEPFEEASELVGKFMINGDKTELVLYLQEKMEKLNVPKRRIAESLSTIINYQEEKTGSLKYTWQEKSIRENNLKTRGNIVYDSLLILENRPFPVSGSSRDEKSDLNPMEVKTE